MSSFHESEAWLIELDLPDFINRQVTVTRQPGLNLRQPFDVVDLIVANERHLALHGNSRQIDSPLT